MSYTKNKLDTLRKLLLGPLFEECKNNPYGVSRKRLEEHVSNLKEDGCIGDCTVDEFVQMCQLKSHIPSCYNEKDRGCVEGWLGKQKGVGKVAFTNYTNSKYFENMTDDDEEDDEDEEKESIECGVCSLDEDLDDNYGTVAEGYRDEFKKLEKMSCGHYAHKACLIKVSKGLHKDNAFCPLCKAVYPITEVPMPILTREQKRQNEMLKQIKDGLATGMTLKSIAEMNLTTISGLIRGLVMNVKSFAEAIGMSEEDVRNEMYSAGDELHPRVIKKYYDNGALEEEYEVKWEGNRPIKDGYFKVWYENGQIRQDSIYKDGELEGEFKAWWDNGQLWRTSYHKDGELEGEFKAWSKDGKIREHSYYKDGEIDGESKEWDKHGNIESQTNYKDGRREGEHREWWSNGQLLVQANYKDDKFDGEYKQWKKDGTLENDSIFENGKLITKRSYKNGLLNSIENYTYTDGRMIGTIKYYDRNGNLTGEDEVDEDLYSDDEE